MAREIVLPIKCSTVKKLYRGFEEGLEDVLYILYSLLLGMLIGISIRMVDGTLSKYSIYPDWCPISGIVTLTLSIYIVWLSIDPIFHPYFTCIKDEEG